MSVNIKEVAEYVAANNGLSKAAAERAVKDAFEYIKAEASSGAEVNIDKFGKFVREFKPERQGRNPATGEPLTIAQKFVVKFKPALDFRVMTDA